MRFFNITNSDECLHVYEKKIVQGPLCRKFLQSQRKVLETFDGIKKVSLHATTVREKKTQFF